MASDIDSPGNSSLLLLGQVLNQPKSWILAHGEYELSLEEQNNLNEKMDHLLGGFPLPYILGHWDFFGRTFEITPDVLIPRPETELMVQKAIESIQTHTHPKIADVGTGSGAIAVSLGAAFPSANIIAVDISRAALRVAKKNADKYTKSQIYFIQSNLLAPVWLKFNLICANLPYIPSQMLKHLKVYKHEPQVALDGGENGLEMINLLLHQAQNRLAHTGIILLEIESSLGEQSIESARAAFPKAQLVLHQDYAGCDRLIEIHTA